VATLTRPEAVTLALYALGGADAAFDTEDIAIRVADIAPGMFAWQKYADRIDKELVRVALSDSRLKKGYVVGSHDKGGWMLTPAGQEFARRNRDRLAPQQPVAHRRGKDEQQLQRERARLLTSAAYSRYQNGGVDEVTNDEADAFFRLNVYVRAQARERKIARVENQFGEDPELGGLVKLLAARARERE
jgi:hypothetical protein